MSNSIVIPAKSGIQFQKSINYFSPLLVIGQDSVDFVVGFVFNVRDAG